MEGQLVKVTAERDKYHEEIVITRDSFEKVEEAITQKMEEIRQQERKSYTAKLEDYERLKRTHWANARQFRPLENGYPAPD